MHGDPRVLSACIAAGLSPRVTRQTVPSEYNPEQATGQSRVGTLPFDDASLIRAFASRSRRPRGVVGAKRNHLANYRYLIRATAPRTSTMTARGGIEAMYVSWNAMSDIAPSQPSRVLRLAVSRWTTSVSTSTAPASSRDRSPLASRPFRFGPGRTNPRTSHSRDAKRAACLLDRVHAGA